jgi:hypothetical protein
MGYDPVRQVPDGTSTRFRRHEMADMFVIVKTVGSTPHVYGPDGGGVFTDLAAAQSAADQMSSSDEDRLEIQPVLPVSQDS